ncbi:MAG: hypothetical protein GX682_06155 [Clostridiaceae bacterium]|nr:hypothetical protein [Clostridiaceae bacterium]
MSKVVGKCNFIFDINIEKSTFFDIIIYVSFLRCSMTEGNQLLSNGGNCMRRLKKMVTAVVLAMSMLLSTLPVMAADLDTPETGIETEEYEVNGLVYRQGVVVVGSTAYWDVTPPAGSNLNLWIDPDSGVTVNVCRPSTPWNIIYSNNFYSETDTNLISNCDGGTYRVSFGASGYTSFDFLLYEWH